MPAHRGCTYHHLSPRFLSIHMNFYAGDGHVGRPGFRGGAPVWIGVYTLAGPDLQGHYPVVLGDVDENDIFHINMQHFDVDGHPLQPAEGGTLEQALDTNIVEWVFFI